MFEQIRVAVVDNHPMFRAGIAHVLTTVGKCEIVAEGAGTDDALGIARECTPDVLILDKLHARNRVEAAVMGQGRAFRRDVAKGEISESW